jgi:hypothetical protein
MRVAVTLPKMKQLYQNLLPLHQPVMRCRYGHRPQTCLRGSLAVLACRCARLRRQGHSDSVAERQRLRYFFNSSHSGSNAVSMKKLLWSGRTTASSFPQSLAESILSSVGIHRGKNAGASAGANSASAYLVDASRARVFCGCYDAVAPESFFHLAEKLTGKLERELAQSGRVNWLYLDATPTGFLAQHAGAALLPSAGVGEIGSATTTVIPIAPFRNLLLPGIDQMVELCELVYKWILGGYAAGECSCVCVLTTAGRTHGGILARPHTVATLFVACYLLFIGMFDNGMDAIEYAVRRQLKGLRRHKRRTRARQLPKRADLVTAAVCEYATLFGYLIHMSTILPEHLHQLHPSELPNRAPVLLRRAIVNGEVLLGDKPAHLTLRIRNQVGDGDEVLLDERFGNECAPGDGIMSYRLRTVVVGDVAILLELDGCLALLGVVRHTSTLRAPVCRIRHEDMDICNGYEQLRLHVAADFAIDLYLEEMVGDCCADEPISAAELEQAQSVAEAEIAALETAFSRAPLLDPKYIARNRALHASFSQRRGRGVGAWRARPAASSPFLSELRDEQTRRKFGTAGEGVISLHALLQESADDSQVPDSIVEDSTAASFAEQYATNRTAGASPADRIPSRISTQLSSAEDSSSVAESANEEMSEASTGSLPLTSTSPSSSSSYSAPALWPDSRRQRAQQRRRMGWRRRWSRTASEPKTPLTHGKSIQVDEESVAMFLLGEEGQRLSPSQRSVLLKAARETLQQRRDWLLQSSEAQPDALSERADETHSPIASDQQSSFVTSISFAAALDADESESTRTWREAGPALCEVQPSEHAASDGAVSWTNSATAAFGDRLSPIPPAMPPTVPAKEHARHSAAAESESSPWIERTASASNGEHPSTRRAVFRERKSSLEHLETCSTETRKQGTDASGSAAPVTASVQLSLRLASRPSMTEAKAPNTTSTAANEYHHEQGTDSVMLSSYRVPASPVGGPLPAANASTAMVPPPPPLPPPLLPPRSPNGYAAGASAPSSDPTTWSMPINTAGGMIPPPPPPPPPPLFANGPDTGSILGAARFARKPRRNVKQLHWSTIPAHQVPQTIFSRGLHRMLDSDLEKSSSEIDSMFMNRPTGDRHQSGTLQNPAGETNSAQENGLTKRPQLCFLESKRATNFEIMLSKFSGDLSTIIEAIMALDASDSPVLTTENLLALRMNMPKDEELEMALSHAPLTTNAAQLSTGHQLSPSANGRDPSHLAKEGGTSDAQLTSRAERLVYEMARRLRALAPAGTSHISLQQRLRAKLDAAIAIRQLDHQLEEMESQIEVVLTACRQIFESDRLASVLSAILAIGNYLNQGTNRGNALGFRLSSVLKLSETRATSDRRTTLLHYLVKFVSRRMPDAAQFTKDLSAVAAASRIDFVELEAEVRALRLAVALVRKESTDGSSGTVEGFLQRSEPKVERTEQAYARMRRQLERTTTYLGGSPASAPGGINTSTTSMELHDGPESLFLILYRFMDMFDRCRAELQRSEEATRQRGKRFARAYVAEIVGKSLAMQSTSIGSASGSGASRQHVSVMDRLFKLDLNATHHS